MPEIKNKLAERLVIELASGKFLNLFPRGTAEVSDRDVRSPHLTAFIKRREIVVLVGKESKKKSKPVAKKKTSQKRKKEATQKEEKKLK